MERTQQHRITRTRELRACTECRKRKLKCDRQVPCTACIRRNEATCCVYARSSKGGAEARLEHLEQLVEELSRSRELIADHGRLTPDTSTVQRDREDIHYDSLHNGATHWSAMLEDIEELGTAISLNDEVDDAHMALDGDGDNDATRLLFGAMKPLSYQQVLSQFLPARHKVDRLVGAYFRMKTVAAPFLHTTQFRRLYQLFWDNPPTTSPLWTSILFSILEIATKTLSSQPATSTDEDRMSNRFDTAAAHCLAVGEYYRPQRFVVEALLLYAQSKCLTSVDLGTNVAVLFGTLARLATVMGYHRDADGSRQRISVFEGEMRRRTWSMCMQLDMLISFQLGLPSNIQFPTWDTRSPTNLLDSDFDENTVQLPPARPATEPTELLFYIAKHRLMTVFEKVIRHTLSATDRPSDELEGIDQEVRRTFTALPAIFHPRPIAESVVDTPSIKVTRLCVNSIYRKCLCVLHRKYVTRGRQDSLRICYTSASDLVRRFLDVYKEFEPGGQLETERWFMGSITWHDFLLGCMALCLTVCFTTRYSAEPASTALIDVAGSLHLLQNAKAVCEKRFPKSKDTEKVRRLVEATILNFSSQENGSAPATQVMSYSEQNEASEVQWHLTPSAQAENDWLWSDGTINSADDTGWAYLEQFLNLPNEDFISDI